MRWFHCYTVTAGAFSQTIATYLTFGLQCTKRWPSTWLVVSLLCYINKKFIDTLID